MIILRRNVHFVHWGLRGRKPVTVPDRIRFDPDGGASVIGAICRAIARANHPLAVVRCRLDGGSHEAATGRLLSEHYHVTLGQRPWRPGVVGLDAGLWLAVDYDAVARAGTPRGRCGLDVGRAHPVLTPEAAAMGAGDGS
jgi:hypothetical protein